MDRLDPRLLTACRLLMEVTAARMGALAGQHEAAGGGEEESFSAPGDNPQFDPARFQELRNHEIRAAAGDRPAARGEEFVGDAWKSMPAGTQAQALSARAPIGPAGPAEDFPADRPAPAGAETVSPKRDKTRRPEATGAPAPAARLTMQEISDYFERDARRY